MAPPGNEINPNIGYWGPTTSTLDWCESNYEVIYQKNIIKTYKVHS